MIKIIVSVGIGLMKAVYNSIVNWIEENSPCKQKLGKSTLYMQNLLPKIIEAGFVLAFQKPCISNDETTCYYM